MFDNHSILGLPLLGFPSIGPSNRQPVDVVTSDHVTKVGDFSFLYCWNYVKPFVCQFYDFFICFEYVE